MVVRKYETPKLAELDRDKKKFTQDIRKKLNVLYDRKNRDPAQPTSRPCPYC